MQKLTTKALGVLRRTKTGVWRCSVYFGGVMFLVFLQTTNCASQTDTSYQQGYAQYKLGHFDSAIVSFSQLIAAHPEKKEGYYNRGLCYYQLNKFTDALHDFNTCLQTDSVFDGARFMKVLILQMQGDWNGCFAEINKMNTNYAGYNELQKRIRYHNLSVYISRNWYYMLAIMFMFILFIAVIAKSYYAIKG